MQQRKCDVTDRNLIAILQADARISTSEISRRLGVARSTVTERIARLETDQIITGYTAVVARDEDELETQSFVYIGCDRSRRRQIVQELRRFPEITECMSISGQHDLMCMVRTPCAEDIDALIDEIADIPGVETLDTTVVLASKFCRRESARPARGAHLSIAS
ncbi:MAG: Lrp/AsnC family transcriptional regulator [Devosiaceae bacterium]|nr:Lrp/AsnC family transcriptional regulator [Devosiaceae bacterium MH13]